MAGSRVWFLYRVDSGIGYAVFLDKSNYADTNLGFTRIQSGSNTLPLPKGIKLRYVLTYQADAPSRKRRFYVGTLERYNELLTNRVISAPIVGGIDSNVNWVITALRGEKRRLPYSAETGLNDGTN